MQKNTQNGHGRRQRETTSETTTQDAIEEEDDYLAFGDDAIENQRMARFWGFSASDEEAEEIGLHDAAEE